MTTQPVDIDAIILRHGAHRSADDGMCLLEAAAYIAGEPWSDHPQCVDPIIAAFGRRWNDGLPDDETRTRILKPFLPRLLNTRTTREIEEQRAIMAADWAVRTALPHWLNAAGWSDLADRLTSLAPLTTRTECSAAWSVVREIRDATWPRRQEAWRTIRDAVRRQLVAADADADAAAAAAAAVAAAAAADTAVRQRIRETVHTAVIEHLTPITDALRDSTIDLFDRMIRLTETKETNPS